MSKSYPDNEADLQYRHHLSEAARVALIRREEQRRWREAQDGLRDSWIKPTKAEIDKVIAEHQAGIDEVLRGRT